MEQTNSIESVDTILAVERALIILKRMAQLNKEIGVRDLSRELGYSPAVTQKILNTLKIHNFVQQSDVNDKYTLGFGVMRVGLSVIDRLDVAHLARDVMEETAEETGETTFLAIRDELSAVYIGKVISPNDVRMDAEVGSARPLNCTAVGKVLMAWGPPDILARMAEKGALTKATPNSIMDVDVLRKQLEEVTTNGFALDIREFHNDGICVAAPIYDQYGNVIASLTISGLASRMEENMDRFVEMIKEKAAVISDKMGHYTTDN